MRVLIIDDDDGVRRALRQALEDEGYDVATAPTGLDGLQRAQAFSPAFVLCDVKMPGMGGLEFLDRYRALGGEALVITITASATMDRAVDAMKRGAYDFLSKPLSSDEVILTLKKAEEREKLWHEVARFREQVLAERKGEGIAARSDAMKRVIHEAERLAESDAPVLLTGERGTGKDRVARMIHALSRRKDGRFVVVDGGAIPEDVVESELFGTPGSRRPESRVNGRCLLEQADGGTAYLDEIQQLPVDSQSRLTRVLEAGRVAGDDGPDPSPRVDVRLIAATSRDLTRPVAAGELRSDLFDVLSRGRIHLPPLRERPEDIPALVSRLLPRFNRQLGLEVHDVDSTGMRVLQEHAWPGNIRELENTLQRAMVLADGGEITESNLGRALTSMTVTA